MEIIDLFRPLDFASYKARSTRWINSDKDSCSDLCSPTPVEIVINLFVGGIDDSTFSLKILLPCKHPQVLS